MDYHRLKLHPESRIAPNATVIGNVLLDKDSTIFFNAVLRSDFESRIIIGEGTNIQEGCLIHLPHDKNCSVGCFSTIGHGAILHGCTIGNNVLIGMGSVIMDGASVGDNSIVAAGAVVSGGTVIPEGSVAVGSPAKVRRQVTEEELESMRFDNQEYIQVGKDLVKEGIMYEAKDLPKDIPTIAI